MGGKAAEELIFGIDKVRLRQGLRVYITSVCSGDCKAVQQQCCAVDTAKHSQGAGSLAAAA
jgi:hypothetical protein